MILEPVGHRLDERGPAAAAGALQRRLHGETHRQRIVAVHLHAVEAAGDGLLRQGLGPRLPAPGHRDGPLVVAHHENHRQFPGPGKVQGLVEITFGGGAVAAAFHHHPRFAAKLERDRGAHRVTRLGGDGDTDGKVGFGYGEAAAALVAAPVKQQLFQRYPAGKLGRLLAVAGNQHVLFAHGKTDGGADGFLAEGGGVGAELPGALQRDGLGVEGSGERHQAVHGRHHVGARQLRRQLLNGFALRVEKLNEVDGEFGDSSHAATGPEVSQLVVERPKTSPVVLRPKARR